MVKTSKPPRILIVEDNDLVRGLLTDILSVSYDVLEAADGISGLVIARSEQPDLAIVDLELPALSGIELAGLIQDKVPFLILTVDDSKESFRACLARGALGYLVKPLNADELLREIQRALEQGKERFNLRSAISQTRTINKALGILMGHFQLPEEQAYQHLVSRATSQRIKVAELADKIITAFGVITDDPSLQRTQDVTQAHQFLNTFSVGAPSTHRQKTSLHEQQPIKPLKNRGC